MPTYNYARYLPEAIDSVLMQEYRDFELIIIDDASSDGTADIISRYAAADKRVQASVNTRNAGMVNNWNRCLAQASGEYIKFLFGDDRFESRHTLGTMAEVLDRHPDVSLVASARTIIDQHSNRIKTISTYAGNSTWTGADIIMDCILERLNRIGEPSAVLFRKSQALRGFDIRYRQLVDLEMWFHLLEQGAFAYIDEPLVAFRKHPLQETNKNAANSALMINESFLLLDEYSRKPYITLPRWKRGYMNYLPLYAIWKLYKTHKKLSRQEAFEYIGPRYGTRKFYLAYPFFKLYKIYRRAVRTKNEL